MYSAKEKSNFCCRCCCGNIRTLDINIRDSTGKDIISFKRPINCAGLCCGILYPFCTQALSVSVNGESAGKSQTLGQNPTFYPEIPKTLVFEKCEFCEKRDFEIVNFVKMRL